MANIHAESPWPTRRAQKSWQESKHRDHTSWCRFTNSDPTPVHPLHFDIPLSQRKTPCVDQSCADCPGFLVLGAGDAPPPELHPGASKCAPGLALALMPFEQNFWICCPQLAYHRCKNGTHSTCFCSTRGHTPTIALQGRGPGTDFYQVGRFLRLVAVSP